MGISRLIEEQGVIEESIPFHQKKDFFQKLASAQDAGVISPPKKLSPPSPPSVLEKPKPVGESLAYDSREEEPVSEKETLQDETRDVASSILQSKGAKIQAELSDVSEEIIPFSERLSGFKRLEELALENKGKQIHSTLEKQLTDTVPDSGMETVTVPLPTKRTPPCPLPEQPPVITTGEARLDTDSQLLETFSVPDILKSEFIVKHEETQRLFEASLNLTSDLDRSDITDDFAITTPDLETPIEGPDAAAKSNNQKMIEVTERVAEVASTLASTLEKIEKSVASIPAVEDKQGLKMDSKHAIPIEADVSSKDEPLLKKLEPDVFDVLHLADEGKDVKSAAMDVSHLPSKGEDIIESEVCVKRVDDTVESGIEGIITRDDKEALITSVDAEVTGFVQEPTEKDLKPQTDIQTSEPSPVKDVDSDKEKAPDLISQDSTSGTEEGRAVKAEVKLLVKTSELGRDAIEIQSIKEFVETDGKKGELSRIFSEAAATGKPSKVPLDAEKPISSKVMPASIGIHKVEELQPCLGSLSIAYEEPPHYLGKMTDDDKSAQVTSESQQPSLKQDIQDVKQHVKGKAEMIGYPS